MSKPGFFPATTFAFTDVLTIVKKVNEVDENYFLSVVVVLMLYLYLAAYNLAKYLGNENAELLISIVNMAPIFFIYTHISIAQTLALMWKNRRQQGGGAICFGLKVLCFINLIITVFSNII